MRSGQRPFRASRLVVGILILMTGCGDGDGVSSPVAPSPITAPPKPSTSQNALVTTTAPVTATSNEGVTLKATQPTLAEPVDEETSEIRPLLVALNSTGFVPVDFGYEFALYAADSGTLARVEGGSGTPRDPGSTSYQVQTPLDLGGTYTWRVRATFEDAFGPWSNDASFTTAPVAFGAPLQLESPIDTVVRDRPTFVVRSGTVEGDPQRIAIQVRVARGGTELTDMHIADEVEASPRGGEELRVVLAEDYPFTPGTDYDWQARTLASTASSRTFLSPWSEAVSFETEVQGLDTPSPVAPSDTTVDTHPALTVRNGAVQGNVGKVYIRAEVTPDDASSGAVYGTAEMQGGAGGLTTILLPGPLQPRVFYRWRALAVAPEAPFGSVTSDWSPPSMFETRADSSLGPVQNPPPRLLEVLRRVAAEHPEELRAAVAAGPTGNPTGPDDPNFRFLHLAVDALREADGGRWGATFWINPSDPNDRGRLSKERVAYYLGNGDPSGSDNIRVIEYLHWATGTMAWHDSTHSLRTRYPHIKGLWKLPRECPRGC